MTKPIELSAEEFRKLAGVPVKARKEDELDGASEKRVAPISAKAWRNTRVGKAKNKLEQQWESELERKKNAGEIAWFGYEAMTFKLADDVRYTPDFMVMLPDGRLQAQECKGSFWPDKNKQKFKVAREQLWFLDFVVVRRDALKRGGAWRVTAI